MKNKPFMIFHKAPQYDRLNLPWSFTRHNDTYTVNVAKQNSRLDRVSRR